MTAHEMVRFLIRKNWSIRDIGEALDGRADVRSIYRWARGTHAPKSRGTIEALRGLVEQVQSGRTE